MVRKDGKNGNLPYFEAKNGSFLPLLTVMVRNDGKKNGKEQAQIIPYVNYLRLSTSPVVSTPLATAGAVVTSRSGSGVQNKDNFHPYKNARVRAREMARANDN